MPFVKLIFALDEGPVLQGWSESRNLEIYRPIRAFTKKTVKRLKTKAIGR